MSDVEFNEWSEKPTEQVLEEVQESEREEAASDNMQGIDTSELQEELWVVEKETAENEDSYLKELEQRNEKAQKPKKKRKHYFEKALAFVAAAVLFGAIAGGSFVGIKTLIDQKQEVNVEEGAKPNNQVEPTKTVGVTDAVIGTTDTVQVANKTEVSAVDVSSVVSSVMPSVVSINCYQMKSSYSYGFGFGGGNNQNSEQSETLAGSGSGIIIGQNENEVLIVTNYHVIEGASRISIEFVDGKSLDATVKGTASSSDLAVVAVSFGDMEQETVDAIRIARMGNSDEVQIGQMAIAIGNALGYGQSVTVGYISAKDRQITIDNVTYTLIQTDAAINPGNSGGALLNVNGEVIGINSVKYSDSSVEGMGFAIPISNITELIEELSNRVELADSEKGYLGIQASRDITSDYAMIFGISSGVYVSSVQEDSPAEKGGVKAGDIIVEIDGNAISSMDDLTSFLSYTPAGTEVTLVVQRVEGRKYVSKELTVTLGNRPSEVQ